MIILNSVNCLAKLYVTVSKYENVKQTLEHLIC